MNLEQGTRSEWYFRGFKYKDVSYTVPAKFTIKLFLRLQHLELITVLLFIHFFLSQKFET